MIIILRQVFLIQDGDIEYKKNFAQGYSTEELNIVLETLQDYINEPVSGKLFHRPIMDFQIVYGQLGSIFYLFVTDLADRHSHVVQEIEKISKMIEDIGNSISKIVAEGSAKAELDELITSIPPNLHPKIALVGPRGAGKTTLVKLLAIQPDDPKEIMSFAHVYQSRIGDILFDMWDFREDDFSPLWNNFVRGSDLILLIFDATKPMESKIKQFVNLIKREARVSKLAILLSHCEQPDSISAERFSEEFGSFIDTGVYAYDIDLDNAVAVADSVIIDILMLKRPLPTKFSSLLAESNDLISDEKYTHAIIKLKELKRIAKDYQQLEYEGLFEKKIKELEKKRAEQREREELEKSKIKAPEKRQFKSSISVKQLPGSVNKSTDPSFENSKEEDLVEITNENAMRLRRSPRVSDEIIRRPLKRGKISKRKVESENGSLDDKERYRRVEAEDKAEKGKHLHKLFNPTKNEKESLESVDKEEAVLSEKANILYLEIKKLGRELRLDLCKKFVLQIRQKLKKDRLTIEDIEKAAKLYVQRIEKRNS